MGSGTAKMAETEKRDVKESIDVSEASVVVNEIVHKWSLLVSMLKKMLLPLFYTFNVERVGLGEFGHPIT